MLTQFLLELDLMVAMDDEFKGIPISRAAEVNIRNNHLQYIFTWFVTHVLKNFNEIMRTIYSTRSQKLTSYFKTQKVWTLPPHDNALHSCQEPTW
jgi:cytochrome oxidase assembly protein ShyY1